MVLGRNKINTIMNRSIIDLKQIILACFVVNFGRFVYFLVQ